MSPRVVLALLVIVLGVVGVGCHFAQDVFVEQPEQLDPIAILSWGHAWARTGNWEKAIEGYTQAISHHPNLAEAYTCRGRALEHKGLFDKALEDYNEAIAINPMIGTAWKNRRELWSRMGQWDKVIADYTALTEKKPRDPYSWNNRAWLLATCPDSRFRDGSSAVQDALKACELSHGQDPLILDTLAAAYAEIGDFERAIKIQSQVISYPYFAKNVDLGAQARLELYRSKEPYREHASPLDGAFQP